VEAVDGAIVLDDTPGGGLTVLIDLPTAADEIDTGGTVTGRTAAH
jgi:hypothetical protein